MVASMDVVRADEATPFREEHAADKITAPDVDRKASELTESVAAALPHAGSAGDAIVRRNLIDEHIFGATERDGVPHAPLANDYEFARRVHLDLTGRIPTPDELAAYIADDAPDKRDKLIERLLASPAWVDQWAYWFGDQFKNCANRIGNASTKHFDAWLRESLAERKPYDQMVREMLTASAPNSGWMPDAAPAAYLARWHVPGDVMYSDRYEDTADEIVVQASKVFLGINYQCISCHGGEGFLEKVDLGLVNKERADLWNMAAFFGQMRVRIVPFQDRFTVSEDGTGYDATAASSVRLEREGGAVEPTFLLTGEKGDPSQPLRPQFARMLTTHPQFARATVNLVWKQFFGLGIVEPVDGFDMARQDPASPPPAPWTVQPKNAALLEELARDFAEHGFDLRRLMRMIAQSSAYQLSSRFDGEWRETYTPYYARHYVRLLTAEQMHDAIVQATGVFGNYERKDLLYETPLPRIRFATEAVTPEHIQDGEASALLRTFGQSNREQGDRRSEGSILQAFALMNGPFVTRRVKAKGGSVVERLVESDKPNGEVVERLFLATLSRPATAGEKELAVAWLNEDRRRGAEDLQWSLLNKLDFVFNY